MGKIYDQNEPRKENVEVDNMIDTLLNVGDWVVPRDDVKFRDNEINHIWNIMNKAAYRTVLLVGDMGCGKRSIIEGYVNKNFLEGDNSPVVNIDFDSIIHLASNQKEFEKMVSDILYVASNNKNYQIIINFNNFGHYLNMNCYGNSGFSLYNNIIHAIKDDGLRIIATCTTKEFKMIEDSFEFILDYFNVIKLTDLTRTQTEDIITNNIKYYNEHFGITLPESVSEMVCVNADKYIKGRPFPIKAEILLDEVCSYIVCNRSNNIEIKRLFDETNKLKLELQDAYEENDLVKCNEITEKIVANEKELGEMRSSRENYVASENDILEAIGSIVDVKMSKLSKDQTEFLRNMPVEIKKDVIGQDETIDKVVKNIRRNRLGLRKSNHSAGNFMFIGSTGVGKTQLAKSLAKYLYGSEEEILRFDMSEFQAEIDVSKLLGSAPGYVGYKESGLLVKGLAEKPECVVLFDEVEKAHTKIYDVLLQLLDEGFVTGSDGKKVDASKALIIFTSNIGVRQAKDFSNPVGFSTDYETKKDVNKEKIIRKALDKRFSPEFLNRIDSICYFNNLTSDVLKMILKKEMSEMNENVRTIINKEIRLTKAAEDWIIEKVEKEDNGARPIIRLLQQEIEETIANYIIDENPLITGKRKILNVGVEDDKIVIS